MSSSTSSGSEDPILEGREGDSHRGDPPDFPQCVQLAIRRGADAMFRAWGVGWRHMNVAVAAEPLLERNEELARIESALAEARTGRGRFVVVEGPGGMGKTALLAVARMTAAEGGMRVLRSRGTELERDFAYGVVRQLFEPSLVEASELERAELLQGAAGVAAGLLELPGAPPADAPPSAGVDPSFAILHGLYWLCANLAAVGPLCLVVDDAHSADAASLRYLAFLLTRLEELDAALVVATRPPEAGTDAELLMTVTTDSTAEVIRLAPLTRAAVAQLLEARLGGAPDRLVLDTCLHVTRGTPFLVHELVEALREEGIGFPAQTVGRSIHLRLGRLPKHAGRLARALAVLEQSDLLQAARLAGLEESEAADATDLLATAGILEPGRPLRFVHPIVRSGIYSELSSAERARGHRRAAELFADQPGAHEHVAKHLLVSEPAADGWVVERLLEAAHAARQQGAPESEAVFLRRVLAEPPPPGEQRSGLLLDLGMAEASAGLAGWPEHLQSAVDAAPDAAAAAEAAMVLAHALSRAQRYTEAVEVLDRASSALDSDHAELALRLEAAAVLPALNGPVTVASVALRRERLRERAASDSAAPPEVLASAAFVSTLTNEPAETAADLATRALLAQDNAGPISDSGPWFSFAAWFSHITFALLLAERYAQLRPLLDASIAQARVTGDGGRLAVGLRDRGWLALRRGDLNAAEGDARTALAATELPAPPMYRVMNGSLLIKVLVDQGRLDDADQALAPLDPEAGSGFATAWGLRFARGRLRVAQGRVAEGLEDLLGLGVDLTRATVTCPSYLPWRSEAALAQLALGDHESAERLATEELELARTFGAPRALGLALRAVGVVAGGERGASLLREAIEAFERAEAVLERARALADLGAMLRRRNRRSEARELLREALDAAHRAGARPLAEYAETELRATGARPRRVVLTGLDSLTASERRIVELAGQGLTNREIAQTLFITARTVEGHLTSVFRKLRVQSRDELPAALASGASVPA
jgi:DNA-binding CsgD family transcriptional regulator/tetratricopeptide (TPR) repeat protein